MTTHNIQQGSCLHTAVVSVADLERSLGFYEKEIGLVPGNISEWSGQVFENYWHLEKGTKARSVSLRGGDDEVGRILLVEFAGSNGRQIRQDGVKRAFGLFNLNFYTQDIRRDYRYFTDQGFHFWSEPVQHDFGPQVGQPIEVVFDGPDGVAINLVQLETEDPNTLIGEMRSFVKSYGRTSTGYTPVVTSAHFVRDIDKAIGFYEHVLGMHIAIDEELNSVESNRFLGLKEDARTRTVFVQGNHMFGKIALVYPVNYDCDDMIPDAVAPNIGYLAQSFSVSDVGLAKKYCLDMGAEIYSDVSEIDLPGRGLCRAFMVRNPGGGALMEIFQCA